MKYLKLFEEYNCEYFDINSIYEHLEFKKPLYSIIAKGRTAKLIRRLPARQLTDSVQASVIAPNPTKARSDNFNLVRWMHESNGMLRDRKHIKSGEPQFMYKTRDYLNRKKKGIAQAEFNKIKL